MAKSGNYLFKVVCCLILLLLPAFINVGQAVGAPAATNVNVVNTPNVNVGTPDVNIINLPQSPVPVREVNNPAIQPYQVAGTHLFSPPESGAVITLYTVPLCKRFIIEYATAQGQLPMGAKLQGFITTTVGGVTAQHQLVMIDQGVMSGSQLFAAAQPMRVYADPGTDIKADVGRDPDTGGGGVGITISGYFIELCP